MQKYYLIHCDLGDGERWNIAEKTKEFFDFRFESCMEPIEDFDNCEQIGPLTAEDMAVGIETLTELREENNVESPWQWKTRKE